MDHSGHRLYVAPMILLRHGQSAFNLAFTATRRDPGIPDPHLTPLGQQQADAAADALAAEGIRHIVASPYTRALQTAAPVARRLNLPITVNPIVRERYAFACDVGSPRDTELAAPLARHRDFSGHRRRSVVAGGRGAGPNQVQDRARCPVPRRDGGAARTGPNTLVVSHWGFLLCADRHGASPTANAPALRPDHAEPPAEIVWKPSLKPATACSCHRSAC